MPIVRSRQQVLKTSPIDNENGLAAWWSFDKNSPADISGHGLNGTMTANPIPTAGPSPFVPAFDLDGENGNGKVITIPYFDYTQTFSMVFWVLNRLTTQFSFALEILTQTQADGTAGNFRLEIAGSRDANPGKMRIESNPSVGTSVYSTGVIVDNRWTHIAVTKSGTAYKFYFDGILDSSPTGANIQTSTALNSYLGTVFTDPTVIRTLPGKIGDFRIYNRALTAAEANAIYNQGLSLSPDEWEMPILQAAAGGRGLFLPPNLNGLGSGGSFFGDRIAA